MVTLNTAHYSGVKYLGLCIDHLYVLIISYLRQGSRVSRITLMIFTSGPRIKDEPRSMTIPLDFGCDPNPEMCFNVIFTML